MPFPMETMRRANAKDLANFKHVLENGDPGLL
jgi:hypothetical protein